MQDRELLIWLWLPTKWGQTSQLSSARECVHFPSRLKVLKVCDTPFLLTKGDDVLPWRMWEGVNLIPQGHPAQGRISFHGWFLIAFADLLWGQGLVAQSRRSSRFPWKKTYMSLPYHSHAWHAVRHVRNLVIKISEFGWNRWRGEKLMKKSHKLQCSNYFHS